MASENHFPNIRDLRDRLTLLVQQGFGNLPVQIVIAPDSTMQALARAEGDSGDSGDKPALMIEFVDPECARLPVCFISTDRMSAKGMPTLTAQ